MMKLQVCILLFFLVLLVLADDRTDYLRHHAIPLLSVNPDSSDNSDLKAFAPSFAKKHVIGLGEATHGTHEFYTVKLRILQYLLKENIFTNFTLVTEVRN